MKSRSAQKMFTLHARIYDWTRPMFLHHYGKAVAGLELSKNDQVLDLGSGTGFNIPYLRKYIPEQNITALDLTEAMLRKLNQKYPDIKTVQDDVLTFNRPFKKAICSHTLCMIDDIDAALKNIARNMQDGGIFVFHGFSWNTKNPFYWLYAKLFRWWNIYPDRNMKKLLEMHFDDVSFQTSFLGWNSIAICRKPKSHA